MQQNALSKLSLHWKQILITNSNKFMQFYGRPIANAFIQTLFLHLFQLVTL